MCRTLVFSGLKIVLVIAAPATPATKFELLNISIWSEKFSFPGSTILNPAWSKRFSISVIVLGILFPFLGLVTNIFS